MKLIWEKQANIYAIVNDWNKRFAVLIGFGIGPKVLREGVCESVCVCSSNLIMHIN